MRRPIGAFGLLQTLLKEYVYTKAYYCQPQKDIFMTFFNKVWLQQYKMVYNFFCSVALSKGFKPTLRGFCDCLSISMGKRQKWSQGQWPSAEDLETIHDKLGFSYRWLITGEGDPFEEGGTLPGKAQEPAKLSLSRAQARLQDLEKEKAALEAELRDANRLNRQLATRLLVEGAGGGASPDAVACKTGTAHE